MKILYCLVASALVSVSMLTNVMAGTCCGTTKDGRPCRALASKGSLYCWRHGGSSSGNSLPTPVARIAKPTISGEADRRNPDYEKIMASLACCEARYSDGTPCSYKVDPGTRYCTMHQNYDPNHPPTRKIQKLPETKDEFVKETKDRIGKIEKALDAYRSRCDGKNPGTLAQLRACSPTYLCPPMKDAWGVAFLYEVKGARVNIESAGPDKISGTEDDICVVY